MMLMMTRMMVIEGGYPEKGTEHRSPLGSKELFCLGHKDLEAQNELFQKFKDTLNAVNPFEMHLFYQLRQELLQPSRPTTGPAPPLFQITPVLNTGLSLSEPQQLYKGYNAI